MNNPLVSIVIPVYNGENYLKEAIESALKQTYQNIEIIIVNDGSNDGGLTEKIALSYDDERIHYYYKTNGGVATALNLAIKNMRGDFFSWLSHDDIYFPTKIEKQIRYLQKRGNLDAVVYSGFELWNMENEDKSGYEFRRYFKEEQLENSMFPIIEGMVAGCTLLIPKKVFKQSGVFDETLLTTQDYDLWLTIFRLCTIYYCPEILVTVRIHEEQGSKTLKVFRQEQQRLFEKYLKISEKEQIETYRDKILFYQRMSDIYYAYGMGEMYQKVMKQLLEWKKDADVLNQQTIGKKSSIFCVENKKICIYGWGINGKKLYHLLINRGIQVSCFTNTYIQTECKTEEGVCCIPFHELAMRKKEILFIIALDNYKMILDRFQKMKIKHYMTYLEAEHYCLLP